MTIIEAINRIDSLKPNSFKQEEKIKWLSTVDDIVKTNIINNYEEASDFTGYTEATPVTTSLLVPSPFDELYLFWLESKIDYWNGDTAKYNNSTEMYNAAYNAYARYYNRTHTHKSTKIDSI